MLRVKYLLSLSLQCFGVSSLINKFIKLKYGNLPTLTVLCYHSIDEQKVPRFERQLDYLFENNFKFISGGQLLELISSPTNFDNRSKYICLTFDDCYENNYKIVRPILLRKKIPAIFFAVSSELGEFVEWDDCTPKQPLMTKEQLKEIALSFDIGAHTQHHVRLSDSKPEITSREIRNSKKELNELLRRGIALFAYPHGNYNEEVVKYISQYQFKAAFTLEQHTNYSYKERYKIGRYIIDLNNFIDFKLKLTGGYDWFFYLKKFLTCYLLKHEK